MAPTKPASFDEIIKADRQRRKNQELAGKIFGKNRNGKATSANPLLGPRAAGRRKAAASSGVTPISTPEPSLASRVGVNKVGFGLDFPAQSPADRQRSASATTKSARANIDGTWDHDLHALNNPQASRVSQLPAARSSSTSRVTRAREKQLLAALQHEGHDGVTARDATSSSAPHALDSDNERGLSIRGAAAGPFVVVASNFAPGTTALDIQTSLEPYGGKILSCRIISASPTVVAEIIFAEREGAQQVVSSFNNQRVGFRFLHERRLRD